MSSTKKPQPSSGQPSSGQPSSGQPSQGQRPQPSQPPSFNERMKRHFHYHDVDKDNILTDSDLKTLAQQLASHKPDDTTVCENLYKAFKQMMNLPEEGLKEEEFVSTMKANISDSSYTKRITTLADILFSIMDSDNDGSVTLDEFLKVEGKPDEQESKNQQTHSKLFNAMDKDNDGSISRDEYVAFKEKFFCDA